ncbi:hypothetical protein NIES25_20320 [Nostoc linckia NIES-25]|nr:hypothetical protein NIES25_20320 [Nostoc linckia NIES-25]
MATINGTNFNDNLVGVFDFPFLFIDFADVINGFNGNDRLTGLGTNDTLNGGNGNDTLDGGGGADRMDGGDNNDLYIVNNTGDIATEVFGDALGGIDTVQASVSYTLSANLENLTLTGSGSINGTGNARGNVITGNSGNNSLSGLGGNDTIFGGNGNDTVNGGTGADRLDGGDNNDLYIVDNVGDIASEVFGDALGGIDTVQASVSYTLSANLENLTLTGSSAINGTGNAKNNVINGNSAGNSLSGLDGNDTINGGGGSDSTNGGSGNDRIIDSDFVNFDFHNGGAGVDTIDYSGVEFGSAVVINLATGLTTVNIVGGNSETILNFENVEGSQGGETIIGSSGNNVLNGNGGNDTLRGENGNDTIRGGAGDDRITGGNGTDVLIGGIGNDVFNYDSVSESQPGLLRDVINDFVGNGFGLGDRIDLSDIDANPFLAGNQAFSFIGAGAFTTAGQLRYSGGILRGNTDFDAAAEFEIQIAGSPGLFVVAGNPGSDIIL